jgi:hypothetical protein
MNFRRTRSLAALPLYASLFIIALAGFAAAADEQPQEHFVRSFAVAPGSTLNVENYKGTIHITGADTNQASITVDKRFEGSNEDRKWWMANTSVDFSNDSGNLRIVVRYPNNRCWVDCDEHSNYTAAVDLTVQVPRRINLDVNGYKPDIKISSLEGDIHVKSYKSPIDIASTTGSIVISTYKESVRLHEVSLRGLLRVSMEKGEATIEARNLGSEVEIDSDKGSVDLRIPATTALTLDYSGGRRASFHSDLPVSSSAGYSSDEVQGTINGGGTPVKLRTTKGSFSIDRLQ